MMQNINFNKSQTFLFLLTIINNRGYQNQKFEKVKNNIQFTDEEINEIKKCEIIDAKGSLFNTFFSFVSGIHDMLNNDFSWATIKLYYSLYYSKKAIMLSDYRSLIYLDSIQYYLDANKKELFEKSKSRNSHVALFNYYEKYYKQIDKLLPYAIDDDNCYKWYEGKREIVNYRAINFYEPDLYYFWQKIDLDILKVKDLIKNIINEEHMLYSTFEEYAIIAIPIYCIMMIYKYCFVDKEILVDLNKYVYLKKIFKNDEITNYIIETIEEKTQFRYFYN